MAGTKIGGIRAAIRNKERHGENFYNEIGRLGGVVGTTGGFFVNRDLARKVGKIGGSRSKKQYRFIKETKRYMIYQAKATGDIAKFRKDHSVKERNAN